MSDHEEMFPSVEFNLWEASRMSTFFSDEIRDSYHGRGASQAAYVAILAQQRIAKALAGARG